MESGSYGLPLIGAAGVLLLTYIWRQYCRPANFPPGPPNLPLVGSLPFIGGGGDFLDILERCKQKYGDIYSMRLGNNWTVILSDYDSIKEACLTRGKEFGGRQYSDYDAEVRPTYPEIKGIISSDYDEEWKEQRHVALTVLKDLGYGKSVIEKRIIEEADYLRQALKTYCGQGSFDPTGHLNNAVTNIICALLINHRFDYKDEEFRLFCNAVDKVFMDFIESGNYLPIQKYFPAYKRFIKKTVKTYGIIVDFLKKYIENRSREASTLDYPSCFIDGYLKMLSAQKGKMQNWLFAIMEDFLLAGMETTTTTLQWAVLFMAKYPGIQEKVQEELDRNIRTGCIPSLKDRANLPYTEATILEILRLASTVPIGVPHKTLCDTQVQGYEIPKNAGVIMFLWNVLRNPDTWPQPEEFRPERFLDEQGQVIKHEKLIPFGIGRRTCLGEQLAHQELFLFFATIMHSFTMRLPEGATIPSHRGIFAFIHKPPKLDICIDLR